MSSSTERPSSAAADSFWRTAPAEGLPTPAPPAQKGGRLRALLRVRPLLVSARARRLVDLGVFAAILGLLLIFFRPGLLLSDTTMTGGDTGAHIYAPWYLRTHLLEKGQLSGWSPGWFAGFPILHFYFPLVATFQAFLSFVIPYEIAFKLGTILGTFLLPVAAYVMLRLMRFEFPTPIAGAITMVGFLFMDSFTIYGGNIPSSLAGEYSFSLSLALCLIFLGLAYRSATEESGSPLLGATVLALAVLSHLIPVMVVVLVLPVIGLVAVRGRGLSSVIRRNGVILALAFALTAFWAIPFLVRLPYTANMGWFPVRGWASVLPRELWPYLALAVLGVVTAKARGDRRFFVLLSPALIGISLYFLVPQGHVWNGRFLPFWYLGVFFCAAYALGAIVPSLGRLLWRRRSQVAAVALTLTLAISIGGWVLWSKEESFIDHWIEYNYEGYEKKPDYGIFDELVTALGDLPPGRVMWEPSSELGRFGTPIALMSLPYWTNQSSMEGIYFESSYTTPFHFMLAAEVAQRPSNPVGGLPYSRFDLEHGIDHMKLFDVDYYVAHSDQARRAADESDRLSLIDRVEGFGIYRVDSPGQVVVPKYEPVVLEGSDWIDANVEWFADTRNLHVPLTGSGPQDWQRVADVDGTLPRIRLKHGGKSFPAEMTDDEIRFSTRAIGEPHWIKTSYFPNWQVEGAKGPYVASPSLMMVIPTQRDVRLHYERTWAEWLGLPLTIVVVLLLIAPPSRRFLRRLGNA